MIRFLVSWFLLVLGLCAQRIELANYSQFRFRGWKTVTVDVPPPFRAGSQDGVRYVVGRPIGVDVHSVDLFVDLAPVSGKSIDLTASLAEPFALAPLPVDPMAFWGGPCTLNGAPMRLLKLEPDGAAYSAHFQARSGALLLVDLFVRWWPDQPAWAGGEVIVTASNSGVPDMSQKVAALVLAFGDALVFQPGAGFTGQIVKPGTQFADGQAQAKPLSLLWMRHMQEPDAWASSRAFADLSIGGVGISRLWPDGNPIYAPSFNPAAWAAPKFAPAFKALHTWDAAVVGPSRRAADTGAQEDQVFVRGEALLPHGVGCEIVAYLSGLKLANRPCHFFDPSGAPVLPETHPQLNIWSGRPHWSVTMSPDRLGKPRSLTSTETSGWEGPDREHWLYNTPVAAARLTGSRALQWVLSQQARLFLLQETTDRRLSTSHSDAARSIGWTAILAVHLWQNLEDRDLAKRVADRWRQRVELIYWPELSVKPGDIWDPRLDPRIGTGWTWMPWQQSVGAWGLDLAGRVLGSPRARELALRGATACLNHAWVRVEGVPGWRCATYVPWTHNGKPATAPYEPVPAAYWTAATVGNQYWEPTWHLLAIELLRRRQAADSGKVATIWESLRAQVRAGEPTSWIPPGTDW